MTKSLKAIPTIYKGIEMRSRMEAQCALLFDKVNWTWQYEPHSYMLPSGASYRPDFYLPEHEAVVETRGYTSELGDSQIEAFSRMVAAGMPTIRRYAVIKEHDGQVHTGPPRPQFFDGCLLAYCECCERHVLLGLGEPGCFLCHSHGCSITRARVLSAKDGKVLLNAVGPEVWARGEAQ